MPVRREQVAAALKYLGDKADLKRRYERMVSLDQPQDTDAIDMALEMGGSLVPGVGQALAARDFERARRADDTAGMAMAGASALPLGKLIGALKGFDPVMREIDVYHGSPHRFEEFDASKIGTGEGAQAYGHGIYLAEKPSTAEIYRRALAEDVISVDGRRIAAKRTPEARNDPETIAVDAIVSAHGGQYEDPFSKAIERLGGKYGPRNENFAKAMELAREWRGKGAKVEVGGNLYTADLPDEMVDRMVDYDALIGSQPEPVKQALRKAFGDYAIKYASGNDMTWKDFKSMFGFTDEAKFAEQMRKSGIPGIKYADAGSRGQGGSGTRNFVVFPGEEKKVKILKRE
jgi:hypothetical protein